MAYVDEIVRSGNRLFRWRSYLPVVFLLLLAPAMWSFGYIGGTHSTDLAWDGLCLLIGLVGLAIRAHVVGHTPAGTSGRNTADGQIAEELNRTGLYSVVRHPLYVGNFLLWMAVALFPHDWTLAALVVALYWLYYERIIAAEEAFLRNKFGSQYSDWAKDTPVFVPRLTGYVRPNLPFSLRNVLRREYSALFALVAILFLLEVASEYVMQGALVIEWPWAVLIATTTALYVTLRMLKKHTHVLVVEGR